MSSRSSRGRRADPQEPRLVGRADQLEQILRYVEEACSGRFLMVLIGGEAGVGKTRLLKEVLSRYADRASCLSGRSYRWGSSTSFGPWIEALDRHQRTMSGDHRFLPDLAPSGDLAQMLKTLKGTAPTPRPPSRQQMLEALVDLFAALSEDRPVLLTLDDIHLADISSWEALRFLSRRLPESPIAVVAAARPGDLQQHPIALEVLLGMSEEGLAHRLTLEPLRRDEVAQLATHLLGGNYIPADAPEALVTWLFERSLGHPLFVISLVRALIEEEADVSAPMLQHIPEGIQERVRSELESLDQASRRVLEFLAVIDRRTRLGELMSIIDESTLNLGGALEHLAQARLVTELEDGRELGYEVSHPLTQETVYEAMGPTRRRSIHRRVGRALLELEELGAAATHLARASDIGDDEAVDVLCRALRRAEERSLYQEALATLAAVLEVLPAGDLRWVQVLKAMKWQSDWVIGHLAEGQVGVAIEAMERIRSVIERVGQPSALGTTDLHLAAFLAIGAGRLEEAERVCRRAISQFEDLGEEASARLARNELAWIRACLGDLASSAQMAAAVAVESEAAEDHRARIHALGIEGYSLVRMGRFIAARDCLTHSSKLAYDHDDTYRVAWNQEHLGLSFALSGRVEEAVKTLEAALEADPGAQDAGVLEYLSQVDWLRGRLASCVARVEQSESRRSMQGSRRRAWALAIAARADADMGREGRARRRLDRARATYQGRQIMDWAFWCDWTDGILAWHNGAHRRAIQMLTSALDWTTRMGAHPYSVLLLVDLAEVAADSDDAETAKKAAEQASHVVDHVEGDLSTALAALCAGWGYLTAAELQAAWEAGEHAASGLSDYQVYKACALEAAGKARSHDDRRGAITSLEEAAATFDQCGAVWRRDRVLKQLAALGKPGRHAVSSVLGPISLTEREREVALLAVQGYTAKETGEKLFISRRTVESHLASVYAKLGVASKRELSKQATELGLRH